MKKDIGILILLFVSIAGFSQNSQIQYAGRFAPTIKIDKLIDVKCLSEILSENWLNMSLTYQDKLMLTQLLDQQNMFVINALVNPQKLKDYSSDHFTRAMNIVSVEISSTCGGNPMTAFSSGDALTAEQKNILITSDLGTDLRINFKFKYKNEPSGIQSYGNKIIEGNMLLSVVPEIEAEFPGGLTQINKYFTENVINKISETKANSKIQLGAVKFIINEEGRIVDAKISRTSTDPEIDRLLLEATNKMPTWRPAQSSNGTKVKQEFSFPFNPGC